MLLHVDRGCLKSGISLFQQFTTKMLQKLILQLKSKIVNIPVFCDGKLDDPIIAQDAVNDGKVDYISLENSPLQIRVAQQGKREI